MGFDLYNRSLKLQESIGTLILKMGVHLGVWVYIFTLSHTPRSLSWPAFLQTLTLVVRPRLRLRHYAWSCQVCWRLDNHGMPCVWCNLSQSFNHCHLWHAIRGHGCLMCVVVEVEWCYDRAHRCQNLISRVSSGIMHKQIGIQWKYIEQIGSFEFYVCCKLRKM
jgi:hypothetical protein